MEINSSLNNFRTPPPPPRPDQRYLLLPLNMIIFYSLDIKPSSVTAELVSCSVTSMEFFDRLQDQGLNV